MDLKTQGVLITYAMLAGALYGAIVLAFLYGRWFAAKCRLAGRRVRRAVAWWRNRQVAQQKMRIYMASMGSGRAD